MKIIKSMKIFPTGSYHVTLNKGIETKEEYNRFNKERLSLKIKHELGKKKPDKEYIEDLIERLSWLNARKET